jgi:sialic acid synthase SpsE
MATLRRAFGVPTGWSDHSLGIELPIAAAALGADLLEKHLTLDVTARGPDHRASLEPPEFAAMVQAVRTVTSSLGEGMKRPSDAERATARVARRSLAWGRSMDPGDVIERGDLIALRPGTGISPERHDGYLGMRTARPVVKGTLVDPADVRLG